MNHQLDAIVIKAVTSFEMKPTVTEHSTGILLTASLQSITLKVTSYRCLFLQEGEKSLSEIETSLSTFMDVLRRTLNDEYLAKGMKLPLPAVFNLEQLTQGATLQSKEGYLLIEAEPKKKHHGPFVRE
ncbi:hypothetical protein FGO68_gene14804 [Halteria grandinella]|uniref:Uncharacterized protein n=1 Tax=Halteria grandinella TaxID=5974 RepID=A0A8J8N9X1_HALGN|nr:hypothetical protein FGO68_gene14804 [Halteria grandinella]